MRIVSLARSVAIVEGDAEAIVLPDQAVGRSFSECVDAPAHRTNFPAKDRR